MLQAEAAETGSKTLRRVLGPISLIAFGIGVIVGAGLFSITGLVAAEYSGPAVIISFVLASLGCCFAALCYSEFASIIPVAGSAYTYSYATMGELVAWVIGWDLVLEYAVAATTVSISWSRYAVVLLEGVGITLPHELCACPWDGGIINLPAAAIVVVMSLFLIRGVEESSIVNDIIVVIKISVIIVFVVLGWKYIDSANYHPFIPQNTGTMGEFGLSGVLRGAAVVSFAFLGFDAVSTAAQESKNPRRDMPIGILCSLLVVTVLYIAFGYVMTGVANYKEFGGLEGIAPVAVAIQHIGSPDAAGVIQPAYPWLNNAIMLAILIGYCSVIMVTLMAQSRVFFTPVHSNVLFMCVVAGLAAFIPAQVAGEMTSIGTLFAFSLVCAAVIILRKTMPDVKRAFSVPFVPLVPILGIITCLCLMIFLPADTWIRLVMWMIIGLDIYTAYGMKHSRLEQGVKYRRGDSALNGFGLVLSLLCIITGFWHQQTVGWEESKVLFTISFLMGAAHFGFYMIRVYRHAGQKEIPRQ